MAALTRGCGSRVAGGCYAEVVLGSGPGFHPVEEFILDQPMPVDAEMMGLSSIGVKVLTASTGQSFVYDIVGQEHYPNVADMIEEIRRHGVSRRLPRNLNWSEMTAGSMLLLLHQRAIILNTLEYWTAEYEPGWSVNADCCPVDIGIAHCRRGVSSGHKREDIDSLLLQNDQPALVKTFCPRLWWHDLETNKDDVDYGQRQVRRQRPGEVKYRGFRRPGGVVPVYQLGIIARFPITRIAVIRDKTGGSHRQIYERIEYESGLDVVLEDE